MAAPPPHHSPRHFGIPQEVTEEAYYFPIDHHPEVLEYVLIESKVWIDVGKDALVRHEYRSWYHHYHDGRQEGPVLEGDVPLYILEAAFGLGTADLKDGSAVDAKDPKLEGDPECPVYSAEGANWSVEEREIVEHEEGQEEDQEWEEPEEEELEEEGPEENYLLDSPIDEPAGDEELEDDEIDSEETKDDRDDDPEYEPDED
ncbi:hypothetical protein ACJRO7_017174 [Eucalyptus globulus]|uniref:Uncharacterized protein n=1 Tax=Eucalyptus globulus TaxID=34317 RepID=A0ABD3KPB0_EUCGL